jgi:CheY-like chemotaxis protein
MAGELILIVDDHAANLKLAQVVLELAGFRVRTAANAEEALVILKVARPELILMDLQLPGIDGLECVRIVKANPSTRSIPIVALTSYAMKGDEEKALEAGCDGYLTKPIDTRTFAESVSSFLAGGEGHADPGR